MPTAKKEVYCKTITTADRMQLLALHFASVFIGLTEYRGYGREAAFESYGAIKEYMRQSIKEKYGVEYLHQFNKHMDTWMAQIKRDLKVN